DSVVALVYKIAHEDADLSLLPRGEKWGRLRAVVTRALARDPQARHQDARGMQDELARALEDLGGEADWTAASDRGLPARGPRPPATARRSPLPTAAVNEQAPAAAEGRIGRANELLEKGRYAAALAEARAVLQRDPGNAEAKMIAQEAEAATVVETRLRNARSALGRGDRETALAEVKAGLAVSGNDAR